MSPESTALQPRLLVTLGTYVTAAAALSFTGWMADLPRLTDWDGNGISIQPNATVAAAAAGLGVLLVAAGHLRGAALCGAVVAAIGAATIFQYLTGIHLGIDGLLMFDRPWGRRGTLVPGRMGPPGSVSWTLIGTALLFLSGGPRLRRAASILAFVVMAIASLSLIGYLFGAARLYTIPTLNVIAFQTATMVLACALGILVALPEQQPMRRMGENTAAGLLTRRLFPLVLTFPIVLGVLRLRGEAAGFYDTAMGTALLVLVLISFLAVVVWRGSSAVHEHEVKLQDTSRASRASIAASEERYRSLVSIITDVPWTTDPRGAFVAFQPAWSTYTGQSWEDMRGFGWTEAIHPDDREQVRTLLEHACRTATPYESGGRLWHQATAEHRHFIARATPLRDDPGAIREWVGSCTDIHEARQAELAVSQLNRDLSTSVRELEAVFRAAPVGIAVSRDRLCEQVEVNAAFATILGVEPASNPSVTGPDAERLPFRITDENGQPIPPAALPLQVAARTGRVVSHQTLIIEQPHGRRVISGSAVPVLPDGIQARGAVAVFVDVTGERKAAAEREELLRLAQHARSEAESASRAKDEFLAILSHELRSPLNAMLGWIHIMKRNGNDVSLKGRAVETLERNLRAQAQIISDLLDISRITSGRFEMEHTRVDIVGVVLASVESLRPMTDSKALTMEVGVPEGPSYVDGDVGRLQQVVTNVVHNAIKFTPERGRISVAVREANGRVDVTVSDNGPGIDRAVLPRIFDRFVQAEPSTSRRHGGLGLGLAIVKQLVERHGGGVRAESDGIGLGTRVTLTFPTSVLRDDRAVPPLWAVVDATKSMAGLDVLIVEDDDDSREALRLGLEHAGARVRFARSAAEALAAFSARPPEILVSDIGMPDEDGYALIRAIRDGEDGTGRRTPAIAMTGFAARLDYEAAIRAGFDEHVGKPVEMAVLFERIRMLVSSKRT